MVKSKLNQEIVYEENKEIDEEDYDYSASQFDLDLYLNLEATIALGRVKYLYVDKNILFVPVYLVKNEKILEKIGIYEFSANTYTELVDEDGDLDVSLFDVPIPLYFSFFTDKYLAKILGKQVSRKVKSIEEEKEVVSSFNDKDVLDEVLEKEDVVNKEMRERESYKPKKSDSWIQKFMKNSNYSLLDNEGGGDCLFAVIRDAFKGIKKEMSVEDLRNIVSESTTEEVFKNFKEHYDMYDMELSKINSEQLKIKEELRVLKVQFDTESSRDGKIEITNKGNLLKKQYSQLKKEKGYAKDLIDEFKWMRGVQTIEEMQEKIKTCEFWAEAWTISILEKALNVKLIILSEANYNSGDIDNVLQCGDMIDKEVESKGVLNPEYYIITSYRGDHYTLIRYNGERIFKFNTLPMTLKNLVVTKCLEKNGGIYSYIPEFIELKSGISKSKPKTDIGAEDVDLSKMEKYDEGYETMDDVKYDEGVVFQFYSKSQDVKPGKGSGEKLIKERVLDFSDLASIKDWRKILSNFYKLEEPFVLDGMKWRSVEHYYQGSKFKKNNPDFYATFSLDSGSELSEDPSMAKAAGGVTGKYKGVRVRSKKIQIDPDFFESKRNVYEMYKGQMAKYKKNELARKVLLATKDAKLQHYVRGKEPIIFYDTMKIREKLLDN